MEYNDQQFLDVLKFLSYYSKDCILLPDLYTRYGDEKLRAVKMYMEFRSMKLKDAKDVIQKYYEIREKTYTFQEGLNILLSSKWFSSLVLPHVDTVVTFKDDEFRAPESIKQFKIESDKWILL